MYPSVHAIIEELLFTFSKTIIPPPRLHVSYTLRNQSSGTLLIDLSSTHKGCAEMLEALDLSDEHDALRARRAVGDSDESKTTTMMTEGKWYPNDNQNDFTNGSRVDAKAEARAEGAEMDNGGADDFNDLLELMDAAESK